MEHLLPVATLPRPVRPSLRRRREAGGGCRTTGACWMDPVLPLQPQSTAAAFCGRCGLSCCYADVDVVSVVWVRVGGLLSCRTGKSPSYVTHAPMVYTFTVAPARGPGDEELLGLGRRLFSSRPRIRCPLPSKVTPLRLRPAEPGIQRSRPQRVSVVAGRRAAA